MKTPCGIIQDLLPLYADGICTPESRQAVEEHLGECPLCRERYEQLSAPFPVPEAPEVPAEGRQFRKGLKKLRRRWAASLIAALLIVPLLLMSVAQVRGDGVCFTNLGQILRGYQMLALLRDGEYGKAFDRLDMEQTWANLTEYETDVSLEAYEPLVIDGETWMFAPEALRLFFETPPDTLEGKAALDFWETVYQHTQSNGAVWLMPEQAYETLTAQGRLFPEETVPEEDRLMIFPERAEPALVELPDGSRYRMGTFSGDTELGEDLYAYCYDCPCVPQAAWTAMARRQAQDRADFEARAARYLDLGYDAWLAQSRTEFIAAMEAWEAANGRLTGIRFHAAYSLGNGTGLGRALSGDWQLEFELRFGSGPWTGEGIMLAVRDGKVTLLGGFSKIDSSCASRFLEVLAASDCYLLPEEELQ